MKKYILLFIGGRQYRLDIDDDLDLELRKSLKDKYRFDDNGYLFLNENDLSNTYRFKQLIYKAILNQINSYDLSPDMERRINSLKEYINPNKSTVYNSDLTKLENLLGEASEIYNSIRGQVPKKSEVKKEQDELDSTPKNTGSISHNDSDVFIESSTTNTDLTEETTGEKEDSEIISSSSTDEVIDDFKEVLAEVEKDKELSNSVPTEEIKEQLDNIEVCKTVQEYEEKTGHSASTYDANVVVERAKNNNSNIILPPSADIAEVASAVIHSSVKEEGALEKLVSFVDQKSNYSSAVTKSFDNLRSKIKVSGLNSRNLNYFGDQFIEQFEQTCRDSGTNFEDMFADYFNGYSENKRYNSSLDKFIRQFITFNGGDENTRAILEAMIVKKAVSKHLISSKYNSYLRPDYQNVDVTGNGYVNFNDESFNQTVTSDVTTDLNGRIDTRLDASESLSGKINNVIDSGVQINVNSSGRVNSGVSVNGKQNLTSNLNTAMGPHANMVNKPKGGLSQGSSATHQANQDQTAIDRSGVLPSNQIGNVPTDNQIGVGSSGVAVPEFGVADNLSNMEGTANGISLGLGLQSPQAMAANARKNAILGKKNGSIASGGFASGASAVLNTKGHKKGSGRAFAANSDLNPTNYADLDDELETNDVEDNQNGNNVSYTNNDNTNPNSDLKSDNGNDDINESNVTNDDSQIGDDGNTLADGAKEAVKDAAKDAVKKGILEFIKKNPWLLGVLVVVLVILLLLIIILASGTNGSIGSLSGLNGYGYIALNNTCENIYVHDTPDGEDGTYPLEEYIAGVVKSEVGGFKNETIYKVGAITARTFALNRLKNSNDCSIAGNQSAQVFRKTDNEDIIEAVNSTRGLVLTREGSLISTQYDAFCWDKKDDQYYYLCQGNYDTQEPLKVPVEWANVYVKRFTGQPFLDHPRHRSHGHGMSQDGAFYLATEQNYSAEQILSYFYGSDTKLMSIYPSITTGEFSINPNDEIYKNLTFMTDIKLEDVLANKGMTMEDYNSYLQNVVVKSGVGTRAAVSNVAVSLIGSLAQMGYKLNYQWGGKYYKQGAMASWGKQIDMSNVCSSYQKRYGRINKCLNSYKWASFDCSGFVNWALINGFQLNSFNELREKRMYSADKYYKKVTLDKNNAVCGAGDVLVTSGHIVLIVGTDEASKKYIVAESTGSDLASGYGGVKLSYYSYGASGYYCGSYAEFYDNYSSEGEE